MFGSYRNVFRSRWHALWWSLGILLTAYCTVPSAEDHAPEQPHAAKKVNPWAKAPEHSTR